ncbi:MAG: hypothetical protein V1755_12840 [Chloroflexota bacterium]
MAASLICSPNPGVGCGQEVWVVHLLYSDPRGSRCRRCLARAAGEFGPAGRPVVRITAGVIALLIESITVHTLRFGP